MSCSSSKCLKNKQTNNSKMSQTTITTTTTSTIKITTITAIITTTTTIALGDLWPWPNPGLWKNYFPAGVSLLHVIHSNPMISYLLHCARWECSWHCTTVWSLSEPTCSVDLTAHILLILHSRRIVLSFYVLSLEMKPLVQISKVIILQLCSAPISQQRGLYLMV